MKIKNVSRKVIGNQEFRLLPGETMDVNGDELWVKMYLADGKLAEEKAGQEDAENSNGNASGDDGDTESGKKQEDSGTLPDSEEESQSSAEARKKGGRRKSESAE